jgi:hypothetical protein
MPDPSSTTPIQLDTHSLSTASRADSHIAELENLMWLMAVPPFTPGPTNMMIKVHANGIALLRRAFR